MNETPTQEGRAEFRVPSIEEPCKTYYKVFGDLQNSSSPPLVVVHGGPGSGHEVCLPFSQLWSLYNIPVVLYDQIGCASSTHLRHKAGDISFWQLDLFVSELENLLSHLHLIRDNDDDHNDNEKDDNNNKRPGFNLLGHSGWGGKIAISLASRLRHRSNQPGIRKLILLGASADGKLFAQGLWELKTRLSPSSQQAIDDAVLRTGDFASQAYISALIEFLRTFLCRAPQDQWPPPDLALDFKNQMDDPTVRETLQGPSPWSDAGVLNEIDLTPLLCRIEAPTLVVSGEFDTVTEDSTALLVREIPLAERVVLDGASHMPHLDSAEMRQRVLRTVGGFLTKT